MADETKELVYEIFQIISGYTIPDFASKHPTKHIRLYQTHLAIDGNGQYLGTWELVKPNDIIKITLNPWVLVFYLDYDTGKYTYSDFKDNPNGRLAPESTAEKITYIKIPPFHFTDDQMSIDIIPIK